MSSPFLDALFDPALPVPAGLSTWNDSDPAARFAVYRNNVVVSLIDALADTFEVTQTLVGEQFFRAMARQFVCKSPPQSPVLAFYGESFPSFIEDFAPAASVPYLADLARLELLRVQAYHAGDAAPLPTAAIAKLMSCEDELPQLRVEFQPSVRLQRSRYAVVSLWAAHQGIHDISTVDPHVAENALILRPALDVQVIRLGNGSCDFVARLLQGTRLGEAFEAARGAFADFDLAGTLGQLIRTQAIAALHAHQ